MPQSSATLTRSLPAPRHVAVIMDGNGRWATRQARPRSAGHLAGARATQRIIEAAARAGVETLTLYAFSADNWGRPPAEVATLMTLFTRFLERHTARCVAEGIRVQVIGRRDRLAPALVAAIARTEARTAAGQTLRVRLAIDYSAREALLTAASLPRDDDDPRTAFTRALGLAMHDADPPGDVDLLIRTGGELRLSDFLLWECAYAELWFTDVLWPDYTADGFRDALAAYRQRDRRFGGLTAPASIAA